MFLSKGSEGFMLPSIHGSVPKVLKRFYGV